MACHWVCRRDFYCVNTLVAVDGSVRFTTLFPQVQLLGTPTVVVPIESLVLKLVYDSPVREHEEGRANPDTQIALDRIYRRNVLQHRAGSM